MAPASVFLAFLVGCAVALFFLVFADRRRRSIRSAEGEAKARAAERDRLAMTSAHLDRATAIRGAPNTLPGLGDVERWDLWAPQLRAEARYAAAVVAFAQAHTGAADAMAPEEMGLRAAQWWHGLPSNEPAAAALNPDWRKAQDLPPVGHDLGVGP